MNDTPERFLEDWDRLTGHVRIYGSDLVLLPEMPFSPWFACQPEFDGSLWEKAVESHDTWISRLKELTPASVLGTRPVSRAEGRFNEGFVWELQSGYRAAHTKFYLPNEEGYWESNWYQRGKGHFSPIQTEKALIGFSICTDIWFFNHAREYGKKGAQVTVCPRATPFSTLDKWLVGGQASSVVSGTFSLSSNKVSPRSHPSEMGGQGWIIGPDGDILAVTSQERPVISMVIDLEQVEKARLTYPRYVKD